MHTRYMERSNSMREKRPIDPSSAEEGQPERKRPALASVIVEALKMDSLQRLCSSLEPILRRVVSEEVERALAKLGPAKLSGRSSPKRIEGPDGRNLQLHFRSKLSLPLFTGGKVEGEQSSAIHVVLLDSNTGHVVTAGPESFVKLDVVVLEGDFNKDDDDWTVEEFESHVVKEREGKRPLLTGDPHVTLREGVGTLSEITFTDNSSWIRSRKFRLGLKVSSGCCDGIRIREAKTDAFTVKDHRGELYKKHYPPALSDEVWRLEKIGKDGSFHKRLIKAGINIVEDFLRLVVRDSAKLRTILGSGMSNKMWDALTEHAKTCSLGAKLYVYYPEDARNIGVVFNDIYELTGLITGEQYYSADTLTDSQKVYVDTLVKKAYDNWMHVVEYDGKSLSNFKQNKSSEASHGELPRAMNEYPSSFNHQHTLQSLPAPVHTEQSSMLLGLTGGYNDNMGTRFGTETPNVNMNASIQIGATSFPQPNNMINNSNHGELLALGQPQSSSNSDFDTPETSNYTPYRGMEDFFPEEEIRMRSNEMLESEDMQHLLRYIDMGAGADDTGYHPYASNFMPNNLPSFTFDEDRTRSSGKAVVGWLKLKAALRWGIFIRKKAAERRAQLVELDDEDDI